MITIEGLSISFGDLSVIKDSNLTFGVGINCIIGQSGAGKSSILNALSSQIDFQAKKYAFGDIDFLKLTKEEQIIFVREHYTYLVQGNNFINDLTCFENVKFYAKLARNEVTDQEVENYLSLVDLKIDKTIYPDSLSGGEKQRLAICLALAKNSEVILCDEITASLDEELKLEIFKLLKNIAHLMNKIVILTSHDEEIFSQCDCIFEIEDQELKVFKNSNQKTLKIDEKANDIFLKTKDFKTYLTEKIERQKWMFVIYSVICALIVSISSFLVYFSVDYVTTQNKLLKRLSQTQINVVNQSQPPMMGSYTYYYNSQPFDQSVYEKLSQIEHIEKIYPYYYGTLANDFTRPTKINVSFKYDDKEDLTFEREASAFEYNIVPVYDELDFENKLEVINPENKEYGIYVNDAFLLYFGLTKEDLIGATIKTSVYMPSAYRPEQVQMQQSGEDERDVTVYQPIGQSVDLSLPVYGYVDFWYQEEWASPYIYMPIEKMEMLRTELTNEFQTKEGELPWCPNAYTVFIDDVKNMEVVTKKIRSIDEMIATGNKYMNNQDYFKQNEYIKTTAIVSLIIVFVAGAILSYAYGIYYFQKCEGDVNYFKRNGLFKTEFKTMLKYDCFLYGLVVFILSIPLAFGIEYLFFKKGMIYWYGLFTLRGAGIVLVAFIETMIQVALSRVYYLRKI